MPLQDKHRPRVVQIEFVENESFLSLPYENRLSLVVVSSGKASIIINDMARTINAPCVLLISQKDKFKLLEEYKLKAQTFNFDPLFLSPRISYEALLTQVFSEIDDQHNHNLLRMFMDGVANSKGKLALLAGAF